MASAELREEAASRRAAVLLVQEPWVVRGTVCGLGSASNRILAVSSSSEIRACIVVMDGSLDVIVLRHLSTPTCVCAQISD